MPVTAIAYRIGLDTTASSVGVPSDRHTRCYLRGIGVDNHPVPGDLGHGAVRAVMVQNTAIAKRQTRFRLYLIDERRRSSRRHDARPAARMVA